MTEAGTKRLNVWALALGIAILPPLWAVVSPFFGVTTGAVALICAGLYVANGNKSKDALQITVGFLLGDFWAVSALWIMEILPFGPSLSLYLTLFLLGGIAVLVGELFSRIIFLPSWLCGWAIGLTIMGPQGIGGIGTLPLQIGVAMIAGVFYVGIGVDLFQRLVVKAVSGRKKV